MLHNHQAYNPRLLGSILKGLQNSIEQFEQQPIYEQLSQNELWLYTKH